MTTPPAPTPPTLTLTTDAPSYVAGQTLTLTAVYADSQANPVTLTITETMTDALANTVSASVAVTVVEQASEQMTGTPSDDFGDAYAEVSNTLANGTGTAVYTTTVTPPAGG